jgi:hypothetical protein
LYFNKDESKVMHVGHKNNTIEHNVDCIPTTSSQKKRILGTVMQAYLRSSTQCAKAVNTANKGLRMTKINFYSILQQMVLSLHYTRVRPHLEYYVQAWRPHSCKETVQKSPSKLIPELRYLRFKNV